MSEILQSRSKIVTFPFGVLVVTTDAYNDKLIKNSTNITCHGDSSVIITMVDDKTDYTLFNMLFVETYTTIQDMNLQTLLAAARYYHQYIPYPEKLLLTLDKYVKKVLKDPKQIWDNLTDKPDYASCLFRNRKLPYFHIEQKEWVKASIDASATYPKSLFSNDQLDFAEEITQITHDNNYRAWTSLPHNTYAEVTILRHIILVYQASGSMEQALRVFVNALLSPRHAHIAKANDVWEIFRPAMKQNADLNKIIRYCMYYAMYILRQEETIMFSRVNPEHRVLFSLEEAASLPPFSEAHLENTPYIQQLPCTTKLNHTMPFYLYGERRINSVDEFHRRFTLATGGALHGVDLQALGAAVTGSILVPCVHQSPLEDLFRDLCWDRTRKIPVSRIYQVDDPQTQEDRDFLDYLEYYYPSYVSLTDADYCEQVLRTPKVTTDDVVTPAYDADADAQSIRVSRTTSNPANGEQDPVPPGVTADEYKNSFVKFVRTKHTTSKPNVQYNQLADIDISITTSSYEQYETATFSLYEKIKANCAHRGSVYCERIKTMSTTKYKIYGPGLPRPIDVFRVAVTPEKMVKKFHVHCVKMFYNNKLTLFRSCVAALLSGVNDSYKWFSCNKIPIDVLFKYAQRGITIIMNDHERTATTNFLHSDTRWKPLFDRCKIAPDKIYSCVTKEHPFFRVGTADAGVRKNLRTFMIPVEQDFAASKAVPELNTVEWYGDIRVKDNDRLHPPDRTVVNTYIDTEFHTGSAYDLNYMKKTVQHEDHDYVMT